MMRFGAMRHALYFTRRVLVQHRITDVSYANLSLLPFVSPEQPVEPLSAA